MIACGLLYAIAAAGAYPTRQVACFNGNGGLTMLMGELATCVEYDLDVKTIGTTCSAKSKEKMVRAQPKSCGASTLITRAA
jgi:Thiamine pyrophosphate enzyme, C-terminal TPP binding domain